MYEKTVVIIPVTDFGSAALFVVVTALVLLGAWANTKAINKVRDAGYRYWMINPLAALHMLRLKETWIFVAITLLGFAVVFTYAKLHGLL